LLHTGLFFLFPGNHGILVSGDVQVQAPEFLVYKETSLFSSKPVAIKERRRTRKMKPEQAKLAISGSELSPVGAVPLGTLSAVILRGVVNNLIIEGFGLRISHCGRPQMGSSDLSTSSRG
jgi:hypothetical protein